MKPSAKMPRTRPGLETLEDRLVLSTTVTHGQIVITAPDSGDNVVVKAAGRNYQVIENNVTTTIPARAVKAQTVVFRGGAGNDSFYNLTSNLRVIAHGGAGNDILSGGPLNDQLFGDGGDDYLYGNGGNDSLFGGDGNDRLFGGAGLDQLFGNAGDDFLDAGSPGEAVNGGDGYDFNAYVVAVNGATRDDIRQGGGPTCWALCAISSIAVNTDLSSRITYLGYGSYKVSLFDDQGQPATQYVYFDGSRNNADPVFDANQEGESWVVITQRAVLQQLNLSITDPPGGNPANAQRVLLGREPEQYSPPADTPFFGPNAGAERMRTALAQGRPVDMCTWSDPNSLATDRLVAWHCYSVVKVDVQVTWRSIGFIQLPTYNYTVTVRNPWGYDGAGAADDNPNDGLVTLSWGDFAHSISGYEIG